MVLFGWWVGLGIFLVGPSYTPPVSVFGCLSPHEYLFPKILATE